VKNSWQCRRRRRGVKAGRKWRKSEEEEEKINQWRNKLKWRTAKISE